MPSSQLMDISFTNRHIAVAGQLHLPPGLDESVKHPAIVLSTPGSSVKEQIGANYARRLAEHGFVALAFDPSYQGNSGGEPRGLEDPATRIEDIRSGVDYLTTLRFVDERRIGALGICAGGGYAVAAAMTEHRIRALSTVVPVNIGRAFRQADTSAPDATVKLLEEVAAQRTSEANGDTVPESPWLPDTAEQADAWGITDIDVLDAIRFYRTPRGQHPNSTNRRHFSSDAFIVGFDAFHLAGELLTQPLQVIVGGRLGTTFSYAHGLQLWEEAANPQEFVVIDGAGHYEMYDEPAYVDEAVGRLSTFFAQHLAADAA